MHCQCQPKAFKKPCHLKQCNQCIGTVLLRKTWTHLTYEYVTESLLGWQWIKSAVWPPWPSCLHARADIALSDNTSCTNTLPNRSCAGSSNILWHDRTRTYWDATHFNVCVFLCGGHHRENVIWSMQLDSSLMMSLMMLSSWENTFISWRLPQQCLSSFWPFFMLRQHVSKYVFCRDFFISRDPRLVCLLFAEKISKNTKIRCWNYFTKSVTAGGDYTVLVFRHRSVFLF